MHRTQPLASQLLGLASSTPLPHSPPGHVLQPPGSHRALSPVQGQSLQPRGQVLQQAEQIVALPMGRLLL